MTNRTARSRVWLLFAVVATLALTGVPGQAADVTVYTSEAAFDAEAPGLAFEDFEDANVTTVAPCPSPADSTSSNLCFSPGDILPGISLRNNPLPHRADGLAIFGPAAGFGGAVNIGLIANYFVDNFVIDFSPPVQAAGLSLYKWIFSGTCTVTATLADSDTEVASLPCSPSPTFIGFVSDSPITSIKVDSVGGLAAEGIYSIKFGDIPSTCSRDGLTGQTLAEQLTGTEINETGAVSSTLHGEKGEAGPAAPVVHEVSCVAAAAGL